MGQTSSPVYSPAQGLRSGGAAEVRSTLLNVRARTGVLAQVYAQALGPALAVPRASGLNPPLWELGHVAWFQQWWIARNPQRARGLHADPSASRLASAHLPHADAWYDSSRVPHADRWGLPLLGLDDTLAWLAAGLEDTLSLLDALGPAPGHDALYFFRLAALHEAMHAEAACYMAQALGIALPAWDHPPLPDTSAGGTLHALHLPAQAFALGSPGAGGFAFDNEQGAHTRVLAAFEIDAQPVGGERFAAFVGDGGYRDPRWWTREGWAWRERHRVAPPRAPQGDAPAVHLSAHEADAWCRWAGRRLPTEAEWECAALTAPGFAWGQVWEWTASNFHPYPGFTPHPYRDYSQPWFGGSRRVLRGACQATLPELAHPRYRNFFEPHRTDVFAGFRSCAAEGRAPGL